MARKTKEEALETRKSILAIALDVIYEKGYARSTFVDIARGINLTKGAVYWHFKTKPEMFIALSAEMEERIDNVLQDVFEKTHTLEDLKRMLFGMIRLIADDRQLRKYYTIVFYRMEWTEELLSIREFFDRQDREVMALVSEVLGHAVREGKIPKGRNVQHLARAVCALFDGLLAHCLATPDESGEEVLEMVQVGLESFFMGLRVADGHVSEGSSE